MTAHARRRRSAQSREQLHVFRPVVEIVVADQHAIGFAAELAVFLLVEFS